MTTMVNGQIHAFIEPEIHRQFVAIIGKGNLTKVITEYMQNVIATQNQDVSGINIRLISQKINDLTKEMSKIKAELALNLELKERYEKEKGAIEAKRLEAEKRRIEQSIRCFKCGTIHENNKKVVKIGDKVLCKGCFLGLTKEEYARMN